MVSKPIRIFKYTKCGGLRQVSLRKIERHSLWTKPQSLDERWSRRKRLPTLKHHNFDSKLFFLIPSTLNLVLPELQSFFLWKMIIGAPLSRMCVWILYCEVEMEKEIEEKKDHGESSPWLLYHEAFAARYAVKPPLHLYLSAKRMN